MLTLPWALTTEKQETNPLPQSPYYYSDQRARKQRTPAASSLGAAASGQPKGPVVTPTHPHCCRNSG